MFASDFHPHALTQPARSHHNDALLAPHTLQARPGAWLDDSSSISIPAANKNLPSSSPCHGPAFTRRPRARHVGTAFTTQYFHYAMNSPAPSSWNRTGDATPATPQNTSQQEASNEEGRLSQAVQAWDDSKPIFKDTAFLSTYLNRLHLLVCLVVSMMGATFSLAPR